MIDKQHIMLFCDNHAAINIAKNLMHHHWTKLVELLKESILRKASPTYFKASKFNFFYTFHTTLYFSNFVYVLHYFSRIISNNRHIYTLFYKRWDYRWQELPWGSTKTYKVVLSRKYSIEFFAKNSADSPLYIEHFSNLAYWLAC